MDLQFVPTDEQLTDSFRKPLTKEKLILLRSQLGIISVNHPKIRCPLAISTLMDYMSCIIFNIRNTMFSFANVVTLHDESILGSRPNGCFEKPKSPL